MRSRRLPFLAQSTSVLVMAVCGATPALAQDTTAPTPAADAPQTAQSPSDAPAAGDIVVTGIRASLERSINIKRNSFGVVDAISAEDIGKFPDTNLAESLQRVTGVSIDRVNNEGAQVTVRGFGPSFNLVTLNGRTLASSYAQTVGGDESADGTRGVTRSFDFSNLASEGVKTLEVYKTGRAAVPSGGIGATINVLTRRPLDSKPGLNGSIGAKLNWDTSTGDCLDCGNPVNPQVNGLLNWTNADQTFGVALFGSYQERNFSTISATSNDWNIRTLADFLNPSNGFVNAQTKINNAPSDPNALVSVPNDSRYHFAEDKYQRINSQGVIQYKPTDTLTITADALYAQTREREQRSDESNWFNRPFNTVTFSPGSVYTTTFLQENIAGVKDGGFEQQYRAQKNTLEDYGLNAKWDVTDNFTLNIDGHYGYSSVRPDAPNGTSSTLVSIAGKVIAAHSVDYSGGIPVQNITVNDALAGNNNGVLDVGDLGSQVGRTYTTSQQQKVAEGRVDAAWKLDEDSKFEFGGLYRTSKTTQSLVSTQQTLGDWGVGNPGDVQALSPNTVSQFCLLCKFHSYDPKASGPNLIAFRGDPIKLYSNLSAAYLKQGNAIGLTANEVNGVKEDIWAGYGQVNWSGELGGHKANLVAGVRYEHTDVRVNAVQGTPLAIVWTADNDFTVQVSNTVLSKLGGNGGYDNLLPSMDFSFNIKPNLLSRFSFSRTIARPDYNNLFASYSVSAPPRPTAIGGVASASTGNPNLKPLVSDNLDLSFEWYYKRDSYLSIGFFDKRVHNFIGTGQFSSPLFGLRDSSSGTGNTLSGQAKTALTGLGADISDVNLFTLAALIQQTGSVTTATSQFQSHYNNGTRSLDQAFVDATLKAYDIAAGPNDPLFQFSVSQPINNRDAEIYGFELAGQHFFGNTGVGVSGSFTYVKGNVGFNNGADPNTDQFALTGLSNTANATLIYDKHGISARLAYNWRDKFLSALNRDSYRNPVYTKAYGQLDMNISYDLTSKIALSIEGINLTNSTLRTYGRDETNLWFAQEFQRRFLFGARYRF